MTPRAGPPQSNPFDNPSANTQPPAATESRSTTTSSPRPSYVSSTSGIGAGLRTPTTSEYGGRDVPQTPPVLGTPGASRPVTGITVGDTMSGNDGLGFGLREPPKMRRAMTKDASKSGLSAASLTLESGSDDASLPDHYQPPSSAASTTGSSHHGGHHHHNPERAPRGTLTIKLIAARNLAVPNTATGPQRPEPYAVIQFEQNEFVSRAPIPSSPQNAHAPFTTAQPKPAQIPRNNSFGPSLGLSSISRAFADAAKRSKAPSSARRAPGASGTSTPRVEQDSQMMNDVLGSQSPSNPIWKEEVAL